MSDASVATYSGPAVVARMVAALVGTAAVLGVVLGAVIIPQRVDGTAPVAHVGPVSFVITPVTMALYGVVVVGAMVLVGLALVRAASSRYDDDARKD